ncbi:MAG TPA: amino acid ABC transporter substrate-binding protein [Caldilineae bacterium]|nr:amino acid ABC transporter substrate-binding protein [Caldilineae bacterium]
MVSETKSTSSSRRRLLTAALAILTLFALALLAWGLLRPSDDAWERLQRGGALRVAVDPSFPPFDDVGADGQLVGFDIDLARELGRRLSVPVEFKAIAFDGLVDAVIADKADVVISAFPLDPRLTKDVRFSQPYFEGGLVLVTREDSTVAGPEDLVGRRVAVEWGSLGDAWARSHGLDILRQETAADALNAVVIGEADAAPVDAVTAALSSAPDLHIHTPPLESDPYVIVLPLHAPKLADAVDDALAEIMADGTWERLVRMHF